MLFLSNLDRRWVFLAMLLAVAVPILVQATFPEAPTPLVETVFQEVERLPPGSRVLFSLDYDPGSAGELAPMTTALLRHCCLKRHRMYFMTLWETGLVLIDANIRKVIETEFRDAGFQYGVDYVNLGFKPGREVVIRVIATDLRKLYLTDNRGTPLDDLPMTRDLDSVQDMDLILEISAGSPGTKEWVQYAASPYGIPLAAGTTGVQAPMVYPYLPEQLRGLLPAIKGAAEYEAALAAKYPQYRDPKLNEGIRRMAPQLWAHLLMVGLIALGNVIYFAQRRRQR